jgi:hypothetical protein
MTLILNWRQRAWKFGWQKNESNMSEILTHLHPDLHLNWFADLDTLNRESKDAQPVHPLPASPLKGEEKRAVGLCPRLSHE